MHMTDMYVVAGLSCSSGHKWDGEGSEVCLKNGRYRGAERCHGKRYMSTSDAMSCRSADTTDTSRTRTLLVSMLSATTQVYNKPPLHNTDDLILFQIFDDTLGIDQNGSAKCPWYLPPLKLISNLGDVWCFDAACCFGFYWVTSSILLVDLSQVHPINLVPTRC
jgi:hypothetical protein